MVSSSKLIAWLAFCLISTLIFNQAVDARSKHLKHVTEENWRDILTGEWMLEFHAPWCPACKDLVKSWNSFAEWSKDLSVNVAEVDVTTNPGLSGRFLVTALPTIYHVKDGVFRSYAGPRDKDDFISFIEEKKWTIIDPIPNWKNPDSFQMSVVAWFFKLSMSVRDLHNYLIEKQGLPTWGSYALFGVATLLLGCVLGFFIVCIIDWVFPATPTAGATTARKPTGGDKKQQKKDKKKNKAQDAQKSTKEEEKLSDIDSSQASEHDSQQSQSEGEEAKDSNVRQRKGDNKKEGKPVANGKSSTETSPKKKK